MVGPLCGHVYALLGLSPAQTPFDKPIYMVNTSIKLNAETRGKRGGSLHRTYTVSPLYGF